MRKTLQTMLMTIGIAGVTSLALPAMPVQAAPNPDCNQYLLTFPAWYNDVASGDDCVIELNQDATGASLQTTIVKIVLNVIDILMQLVAYASVVYLIMGGFRYLTSAGLPDQMTSAKKTILNAIYGLIIGMLAVAIVNLVGASL